MSKSESGEEDRPACSDCDRRLTEILVFPEIGSGDSPVKFDICLTCEAELVETLRQRTSRTASGLRH